MDKDNNDGDSCHTTDLDSPDTDKSLVGKFKSHVSGIINNTPLSKWFRKNDEKSFRRREDEQDDELFQMQPPMKKAKLPPLDGETAAYGNHYTESSSQSRNFSSFPEPVAGPSGIKSRKLLNSSTLRTSTTTRGNQFVLNGHKDSDSEESTSGYSSVARISSKEQVFESRDSSKQTSPLENSPTNSRSLFNNKGNNLSRSLFNDISPKMNTSLSSRRPSFNLSTFGSPNFVDKTMSTKRIINSPFYSGRTIYGGAAAYGRRANMRKAAKNTVQIKPINRVPENSVALGKTAQRILHTLEQYSTPINDAKKIPMASKKMRSEGILSKYTGANPYTIRDSKSASNSELHVPSVSDLLKMKQSKERLQESTVNVRELVKSSNFDSYKVGGTNDSDQQQKYTGKIKNKVSAVRQKPQIVETAPEITLTPIALPLTTLPKFDLKIPSPTPLVAKLTVEKEKERSQSPPPSQIKPANETEKEPVRKQYVVDYKFSKPYVISENLKFIVGINNYKFSEPLSKNSKQTPAFNFNMPVSKTILPKMKHNGDNTIKAAKELKSGSVMDILGKKEVLPLVEKFKPTEGTWECSICLIRNQPDKTKCVACEASRVVVKPVIKSTKTTDTWECDVCLIKNKTDLTKCAACETPKPGAKPINLLEKFKQPEGTWECDSCLVKNKNGAEKCVACEASKPGAIKFGIGDKFKSKEGGEWECNVCLVKNQSVNTKCLCCEAENPKFKISSAALKDLTNDTKVNLFNFGVNKSVTQSFSFGIPTGAKVEPATATPAASVFGEAVKTSVAAAPATFSFGIPAQEKTKPEEPVIKSPEKTKTTESAPVTTTAAPAPVFSFGSSTANKKISEIVVSSSSSSATESTTTATTTTTFSFKPVNGDLAKTPMFSFSSKTDAPKQSTTFTLPTTSTAATPSFNFGGASKPVESSQTEAAKPPMFKFGSSAQPTSEANPFEPPAKIANGFAMTPTATTNFNNSTAAPSFGTTANFSTESKQFSFGGSTTNNEANKAPVFSFGQASATPASTGGGFSFSAPPAVTAAAPPAGMFFSAPKNDTPSNSAPMFGAAPTVKNGTTFNFGANASNNAQKAGFSFGATSNTGPSSGFNFGAAPTAAPAAGGFNFSSATAFDSNVKPTFNFSQGQQITGFAAPQQAADGQGSQRKIKKAVRRTQR